MRNQILYLVILIGIVLSSCESFTEIENEPQSIKEVYLIQSRLIWNEDETGEAVGEEPKTLMLGYSYLDVKTGKVVVGEGRDFKQVNTYSYGTIGSKEIERFLSILSNYTYDKHFQNSTDGELIPLYSGPEYAFYIIREDGSEVYISFKPYLLPQDLKDIYNALDFDAWELKKLPPVTEIDQQKLSRLKELTLDNIDKTGWPPIPSKVIYTPPKIQI